MKLDARARRLRFAPPNPKQRPKDASKRLALTDADFLIFEAIDRHGPLPTHYLYEFWKRLRRGETHFRNRLTEFYNGDEGGPYLSRPPRQFDGFEARYQHVVYDLAPRARTALAGRGTLGRYSPKRTDPFLHQLMGACFAASIELAATEKGVRYISREEILIHEKAQRCRDSDNPMALPLKGMDRRALIPDDLFALQYPDGKFRFFAVEIDRNTESIERKNVAQSSYGSKVAAYDYMFENRLMKDWWGIPNLTVLTLTTNPIHGLNLMGYTEKHSRFPDRYDFASDSSFGANWRVPKTVLTHLYEEPWMTVAGPKHIDRV